MSMNGRLRRVSDAEIDSLLERPERVQGFLFGAPDAYEDRSDLNLEKDWHGVHYLLTQTDRGGEPPLDFLVAGGEKLGGEKLGDDLGYGPARAFRSADVRRLADALRDLDDDAVRRRFDPERMDAIGIYPMVWDRDDEREENERWLIESFRRVTELVLDAARAGSGLVVYVV